MKLNKSSFELPKKYRSMGHVKQKKSSGASTPPDMGTEMVPTKGHLPHSTKREPHARPAYPEQLNVGELISQINCRNNTHNEISSDNNNNSNRNNNSTQRTTARHQPSQPAEPVDVEKGSEESPEDELQRRERQKPLFRRLIAFIRNLWIGAKFTVGSDGKQSAMKSDYCDIFGVNPGVTSPSFLFQTNLKQKIPQKSRVI